MRILKQRLERVFSRWMARMTAGRRDWTVEQIGDVLWESLDPSSRTQLHRGLARKLGVASIVVPGVLGNFEGSVNDHTVLDWYMRHGNWETWLQSLLKEKIFASGAGSYIDIGANIGLTCVPLALERGVRCFAFEPEPANFDWLRLNSIRNRVEDKVTCFKLALYSSDAGNLEFEVSSSNLGDHRVRVARGGSNSTAPLDDAVQVIHVPCMKLDTALSGIGLNHPVAIKMDVQGSEMRVIEGGKQILAGTDFLVAEVNPQMLNEVGDSAEKLLDALAELGFAFGDTLVQHEERWAPRLKPFPEFHDAASALVRKYTGRGEFNIVLARDKAAAAQLSTS